MNNLSQVDIIVQLEILRLHDVIFVYAVYANIFGCKKF